ncbi:uncharacterized protein K460DRAFT_359933 [Cucurbitaria berberidis CBS 394.84]|uniref:F-box domain-containing protein n=1 Tax=Cucurbitaria berberidis CBS 394.84 TaxID=1168544 RepID=A0A9P4G723_9PLEO|nr:uncharacterized protein K460DRAFT_359933 [Cucurbitaria berberidis CBS 394.84]KAF1840225.1 hypothetical protein K460DRAFT_359933 [Cucurbitaria berberidis CBS 394.84]
MRDTTSLSSSCIDSKSAKSLNDLPNEILLLIFSHVDPHREDRILGHIPDDPSNPHLINDFLINSKGLCSLALTCKRFLPLAQEQLLYAPVIGGCVTVSRSNLAQTRMICLLRTLLANPERTQYVKQLRLCLPMYEGGAGRLDEVVEVVENSESGASITVKKQAYEAIKSLNLPLHMKERWQFQMSLNVERALVGLFFALRPQLERMCIAQSTSSTRVESTELYDYNYITLYDYMRNPFGLDSQENTGVSVSGFGGLQVTPSLTYLKVVSRLPMKLHGLEVFPNLRTLDMSTKLANYSRRTIRPISALYASPEMRETLQNIHHLRLDFQIKSVGIWDIGARVCLTSILQAFQSLQSLDCYAEPSDSKNPFRSVRAFPHYQANIQHYPDAPPRLDVHAESQDYWDQRIYDARTEITNYQHLVDALVHLRPQLETLRLPGGFWTLPGGMRKPLPRFDGFARLSMLSVPQAAVLSVKLDNMRFADVHGDFELSPVRVLPLSLRHLKVFDADVSFLESEWLRELFVQQKSCNFWPGLVWLEILLGPSCKEGEVEEVMARRSQLDFWAWVKEATFEVFVGRDLEVPQSASSKVLLRD